jgi:PAS domain S-box-containing protein
MIETRIEETADKRVRDQDTSEPAETLHASEAKLRRITESGIVGVFYWTMAGTITEANDAFLRMLGRDRADLESGQLDWRTLTPPEWVAEDERRAAEVVERGVSGPWEKEFFTKNGQRIPVLVSGAVLDDKRESGLAVCLDITERWRMEEWLRLLSEALPVIVWTALPSGQLDHVGGRALDFFGISVDTLLGEGWQVIIHPDDLALTWEKWKHSLATGDPFEVEYRFRRYDGTYRWFLGRARPMHDDAGRVAKWFGSCTEIHNQKMAEEERDRALAQVERERERLQEIFLQAPAMIAVSEGPTHIFRVANPHFQAMVGSTRKVLGRTVREAFPDVEGQGFFELMDNVFATGKPFVGSEMLVHNFDRKGTGELEDAYFNVVYQPLTDAQGAVTGIMTHAVDVTAQVLARQEREQRTLELERLTEAEQRARAQAESANRAKAEFLSSMSHDLRAPLNAVGGYASLVLDGLYGPTTEKQREGMHRILRAQQHLLAVIRDILDFARIEAGRVGLDIADVPVKDVLQEVEVMIEQQMTAKNLVYECNMGEQNAVIRTDRERAVQVLLNLLTNALKFTDKGSVTVDWTADEQRVSLNVRDTGRGIPADRVAQIFEPFVQVGRNPDEARQGIGLGLAISRQLARNMGGDLRAESTEGVGSVFTLELPRAHA